MVRHHVWVVTAQPVMNYINAAVDTVMSIVRSEGPGDVLVFLPGMEVSR